MIFFLGGNLILINFFFFLFWDYLISKKMRNVLSWLVIWWSGKHLQR